jgi:hypothetical protein
MTSHLALTRIRAAENGAEALLLHEGRWRGSDTTMNSMMTRNFYA